MANRSIKRILHHIDKHIVMKQESYGGFVYGVLNRFRSQSSKTETENPVSQDMHKISQRPELPDRTGFGHRVGKYSSDDDDVNDSKQKSELAWLTKAMEPALQFYRWALPTGNGSESKFSPTSRSLADIVISIQKSKIGIEDWSLSDLTIGLYLIYLRQASANLLEDVKGVQISSEPVILDLIYHLELAKGCYRDTTAGLAKQSMLRETNIIKFVKNSNVMRPGYYIGVDPRKKLVILGIRGTHTISDIVTDIVSTSDGDVTFEGYSTHFGTAEAARWFLDHEMKTIKKCLNTHKGFRLRLVGHSLGASTASLLAIMLRKKSATELGFDPDIITAVGYATPPCVSKGLAESCCDYVATVVLQDDIVPRLSAASLARLRNEIIETDWKSVLEKEDWKNVVEFLSNAKHVISSVQDVARKVADYAKFGSGRDPSDIPPKEAIRVSENPPISKKAIAMTNNEEKPAGFTHEELFIPGSIYYLKRNSETKPEGRNKESNNREYYTLWKRDPDQHFQRILLSSNLISAHKCDSHYSALRDVLKGLPESSKEGIF